MYLFKLYIHNIYEGDKNEIYYSDITINSNLF